MSMNIEIYSGCGAISLNCYVCIFRNMLGIMHTSRFQCINTENLGLLQQFFLFSQLSYWVLCVSQNFRCHWQEASWRRESFGENQKRLCWYVGIGKQNGRWGNQCLWPIKRSAAILKYEVALTEVKMKCWIKYGCKWARDLMVSSLQEGGGNWLVHILKKWHFRICHETWWIRL